MLHILWMLIKFILIVVGILLALVLLAILLLLFDPVRYRAQVKKYEEGLKAVSADACVSWLFGLISLRAAYENGQPCIAIRIFGIPLDKLRGLLSRKKASASSTAPAKKTKDKRHEKQPSDVPEKTAETATPPEEDRGIWPEEAYPESQTVVLPGDGITEKDTSAVFVENETPSGDAPSAPGLFSRIWGMLKTILGIPVRVLKFLFSLPGKIAAAIQKICVTIQGIRDKISWWSEFLQDEQTKALLLLVKQQAAGLIRHILPTRVTGDVTFGCEDPSLTGKILAVLGMSFPLHKNCIAVTPLFDGENHLTGRVVLKGRIYGIVVLIAALKILFNKNTKYVISQWKSRA